MSTGDFLARFWRDVRDGVNGAVYELGFVKWG